MKLPDDHLWRWATARRLSVRGERDGVRRRPAERVQLEQLLGRWRRAACLAAHDAGCAVLSRRSDRGLLPRAAGCGREGRSEGTKERSMELPALRTPDCLRIQGAKGWCPSCPRPDPRTARRGSTPTAPEGRAMASTSRSSTGWSLPRSESRSRSTCAHPPRPAIEQASVSMPPLWPAQPLRELRHDRPEPARVGSGTRSSSAEPAR